MAYVFHALLLVIAAACTFAVVWPIRKASPKLFVGLLTVVPLLALGLYMVIGTPAALDRSALQASREGPASLDDAIAELVAELERNPAQPEGWVLLGRSQAMQGQFAQARASFDHAMKLLPDEAGLLLEAAEVRAQGDPQNRFDDEALAMLQRVVALEPGNQRAPWFIGIAQRQRGDDAAAAATWEALLPKLDAATGSALRQQIAVAREAAGLPPLPDAPASSATQTPVAAPTEGLRVRVVLDPDFASRVRLRGDTTVFVIARLPGGPPMPVAVERHTLQDLPLDIVLDDSDSPMPTQKLSSLASVEVFARLSASGDATRQEGDIDSPPVGVDLPATTPIDLVIGVAGSGD